MFFVRRRLVPQCDKEACHACMPCAKCAVCELEENSPCEPCMVRVRRLLHCWHDMRACFQRLDRLFYQPS